MLSFSYYYYMTFLSTFRLLYRWMNNFYSNIRCMLYELSYLKKCTISVIYISDMFKIIFFISHFLCKNSKYIKKKLPSCEKTIIISDCIITQKSRGSKNIDLELHFLRKLTNVNAYNKQLIIY